MNLRFLRIIEGPFSIDAANMTKASGKVHVITCIHAITIRFCADRSAVGLVFLVIYYIHEKFVKEI